MILDYHKILGVSKSATREQIKKAYYKKVKLYHPDRNPSEKAHEQFLLIHEAYDALLEGRTKRIEPRNAQDATDVKGTRAYYEKRYHDRYQQAYQRRGKRSNIDHAKFVKNKTVGKVISWFPVLPLLFVIVLFADAMLPVTIEVQTVLEKTPTSSMQFIIISTEAHEFLVDPSKDRDFSINEQVEMQVSPIFSMPERVLVQGTKGLVSHKIPNVVNTYFILPIALLLFCLFGISSVLAGRQNEMLLVLIVLLLWAIMSIMYC